MQAKITYRTSVEAAEELRRRNHDGALRQQVESWLGDKWLPLFGDELRAMQWPSVRTPNVWCREFLESARTCALTPLVFEFEADRMHSANPTKRHLAKLLFWNGKGRNGGDRFSKRRLANLNDCAGKPFCDVRTIADASFLNVHRAWFDRVYPNVEHHDISQWYQAFPTLDDSYRAYLSLCLAHCVLFESFLEHGSDKEFTDEVAAPAFEWVANEFGHAPLIVAPEPVAPPIDLYWYAYDSTTEPALNAVLAESHPHRLSD